MTKLIYPDNTFVTYEYDKNHNLTQVTDWSGRITVYEYDNNNRLTNVTKPDGSTTLNTYDTNTQRLVSSVERTSEGVIISGFEYEYDDNSRIICEKILAKYAKICYTYDDLNRVISREIKSLADDSVISTENYSYDDAGNITLGSRQYDINNRMTVYNSNNVSYDLDGNMTSDGENTYTYDYSNRLTTAGGHTYTYTSADVRIKDVCGDVETRYVYNTNCKLSQLLVKTVNGTVTKYVYGRGLIGEETGGTFKTYHYDCRGSTVAITDMDGNVTDTFEYDTYGKLTARTGTSDAVFLYNGRDGVITEPNGLYYMRARYYSPDKHRFINADIIPGKLDKSPTLNRFAYADGNPVMNVDPLGLFPNLFEDVKDFGKNLYDTTVNWAESEVEILCNFAVDYASAKNHTERQQAVTTALAKHTINTAVSAGLVVADAGYRMVRGSQAAGKEIVSQTIAAGQWVDSNVINPAIATTKRAINAAYQWTDSNVIQPVERVVNDLVVDYNNFDINNTDPQKVYNSQYFSAYKGKFVIRAGINGRSGSVGVLFIDHSEDLAFDRMETIDHEYGHTKQLDQMGLVNYLLFIGLPSWQKWGPETYYRKPWEITADIYGGVNLSSRIYDDPVTQTHIDNGNDYMDIASSNLPIWEKYKQLRTYY